MSAYLGEVIGTMILIILGGGVVGGVLLNKSKAQNSGWIVITFGWGLAVAMAIYAVGGISGAHINPAVTLGLAAVGEFPWAKVPGYVLSQMLGAVIGAVIVYFHYLPHWKETDDKGLKLAVFSTAPAIRHNLSNIVSEIIGTFILVMAIMAIGPDEYAKGLFPLIIGFLILSIGLSLGGTTGYAINPARDLGPRIAHFFLPIHGKGSSDWGYSWIPVIGPIMGGVYGAVFYKYIFLQELPVLFWISTVVIIASLILAYITEKNRIPENN